MSLEGEYLKNSVLGKPNIQLQSYEKAVTSSLPAPPPRFPLLRLLWEQGLVNQLILRYLYVLEGIQSKLKKFSCWQDPF